MEKPNINVLQDKGVVKDGIHMIIGLQMNHTLQQMLREKMLGKLEEMWVGFTVQNSWDSVLDEGISKGSTNWQLYGSRKPGNEAYEITQYWKIKYDPSDGQLGIDSGNIDDINLSKDFIKFPFVTQFHRPT